MENGCFLPPTASVPLLTNIGSDNMYMLSLNISVCCEMNVVLFLLYSIWGTLVMQNLCTEEYTSNFLTLSTSENMFESAAGNHDASPCIR